MILSDNLLSKLGDEFTRKALEAAGDRTHLRAIFTISKAIARAKAIENNVNEAPLPDVNETRPDMRARLIRSNVEEITAGLRSIIKELEQRGLHPKGENRPRLSRMIVVDGDARDILHGADLDEVERFYVDRELQLDPPIPAYEELAKFEG